MISSDRIKDNISKNIVKYREKAGLSQKDLAKLLETTPSRISNWEQGANCPTMDMLIKVCDVLNISINDIYGIYPDSEIMLSYDEQEHIRVYRQLDSFGKEFVEMVAKRELKRAKEIHQQNESKISEKLAQSRIVSYFHHIASAGNGEYLFDDMPTDLIKVKDTPISRQADFVIGVNGDSMEPDYCNGEKVFVETTPDVEIGEVGIFLRGNECIIKERGKDGLISKNNKYPNVEPYSDGIKVVGKVIGKVEI